MYKYKKYLKKNMFGGDINACPEKITDGFVEIQTEGYQNCGIYVKDNKLTKCEYFNDGKIIDPIEFENITKKLMEIKKSNPIGLLPEIYSYCKKEINDVPNYYTEMEKLDGNIVDFLLVALPNLIIEKKYNGYKQDFEKIIHKILNFTFETPQMQQSTFNTPQAPYHNLLQQEYSESTPQRNYTRQLYLETTPPRYPVFNYEDNEEDDFFSQRQLFGGSDLILKFNEFLEEYTMHYNIHLELINKKIRNIMKVLYENYLFDDDANLPQNFGYKLVDYTISENFEYGYSVEGEIKLNILLYKLDFMSLKILTVKEPNKSFDKFKFGFLDDNRNNFLSKYKVLTGDEKTKLFLLN